MREMEFPISKEAQTGRVWLCEFEIDGCTRTKPCARHLGRRNRRKGQVKQRAAKKALGVPDSKFASQGSHEENWRGQFRVEIKAGAQVRAGTTLYLKCERQSDLAKAEGDARPFLAVAMPDGMSDGLVTLRLSTWNAHIVPLIEEYGGTAA